MSDKPNKLSLEQIIELIGKQKENLAANESKFRSFVNAIAETLPVVIVGSKTGTILFASKFFSHMFGYKKDDELLGTDIHNLIPESTAQKRGEYIKAYLDKPVLQRMAFNKRALGKRKDGSLFKCAASLSPQIIEGGTIIIAVLIPIPEELGNE